MSWHNKRADCPTATPIVDTIARQFVLRGKHDRLERVYKEISLRHSRGGKYLSLQITSKMRQESHLG